MAQETLPGNTAAAPVPAARATSSRRLIAIVVVAVLGVAGAAYWLYARQFEDTDDAQIDGNISNVSPRVSGTVSAVYVLENQHVKQGDVLAEIDPTDLQIAVDQAKAQVAEAQAQLEVEHPSVPITLATNESTVATARSDLAGAQAGLSAAIKEVDQLTAQLAQAEANNRTAQLEKQRAEKLISEGAIAQSDYDQRVDVATAAAANTDATRQSLAAAKDRVLQQQAQIAALRSHFAEVESNAPRQIETRRASVVMRQAALDLANAELAQAEKNLGYAKVTAPISGIVARKAIAVGDHVARKAIAVGDHVAPGQEVVGVADDQGLWVTADYRETQLERMQPGQSATVHVDSLGVDMHGAVESLGGATGSRLSVLPPENATGNYVKVVQRIPVRIRLDPGQPGMDRLRIGMSVEPRVTVR